MKECETRLKTECITRFVEVAKEKQVQVCAKKFVRDCDATGDVKCSVEYETSKHRPLLDV